MKNKPKLTIFTVVYIVTALLSLVLIVDGVVSKSESGLFWFFSLLASTWAYAYLRKKCVDL